MAIATISACIHKPQVTGRGSRSRHSVARSRPVAAPSLAVCAWMSIAIRLAATTTQSNWYPNAEPLSKFVAKLPGSTYAIAATNAGPSAASARRPSIGRRAGTRSAFKLAVLSLTDDAAMAYLRSRAHVYS
ncbi:exported hypothetical protein [metagenome]|uniref:Uncharacterized protein n=1 Tax=metagenome TaxID=256318 RepID=A0A2P2C8V2_9ZZZZ